MDEQALTRVEKALARVKKAIQDRWSTPKLLGFILVGFVFWSLFIDIVHAKWPYAAYYGVHSSDVYVQTQPDDCAFLAAPLGVKHCHYERTVLTVRWTTSMKGKPIISYDDGKTWSNFEPPAKEIVPHGSTAKSVYIDWEKKED